jgi:hypothetical protein
MSSKRFLDDIVINPEATEDETEVVEESAVSVPQHKGAKEELTRQRKIISETTGEPITGPFSKKAIVSGTRGGIGTLKKSIGQQKSGHTNNPLKGLGKRR